jgi:hypothetical protein
MVSLAAVLLIGCSTTPGAGTGTPGAPGSQPATTTAALPSSGAPVITLPPAASATTSTEPTAVDPKSLDMCGLFTADEIGGIIGDAVQAGKKLPASRGAGCQWDSKDTSLLKFVQVVVEPFDQENWDIGLQQDAEPVKGVGDDAYRTEADIHPPGVLTIRTGSLAVTLIFYEDPADESKVFDQQVELGTLVVSRLAS